MDGRKRVDENSRHDGEKLLFIYTEFFSITDRQLIDLALVPTRKETAWAEASNRKHTALLMRR
jgi:hypothetical protein